jgi:hypothetical protein
MSATVILLTSRRQGILCFYLFNSGHPWLKSAVSFKSAKAGGEDLMDFRLRMILWIPTLAYAGFLLPMVQISLPQQIVVFARSEFSSET